MEKTLLERYVEDPIHMRLFQQERAILEATALLESTMAELGVSRAELARRLGKTKGWVTQLLDGEANKTIRTVADAFAVLGREYHSTQQPIQVGAYRPPTTATASSVAATSTAPSVAATSTAPSVEMRASMPQLYDPYGSTRVSVSSPPEASRVVVAMG